MSGGPAGFPHQYGDPNEMPVGRILAGQTRRGLPVANCMNGVTMCLHVAVFFRLNHVDVRVFSWHDVRSSSTRDTNTCQINSMKIMKTNRAIKWMAVCAAVLTATAAFRASADQPATAARPEKSYTGTVISVDPQEHVLSVKEWALSKKTFNLGDNCAYDLLFTTLENNSGTANDLRPGEKVTVSYQDSHGVLIADRVEQQPMRFEGMVTAIDPGQAYADVASSRAWTSNYRSPTTAKSCFAMKNPARSPTFIPAIMSR